MTIQDPMAAAFTNNDETLDTLDRRYFSQKERDSMPSEDFAGPHESFPIKSQQDVYNAAKLIGHAEDPAAVKAAIKRIAKKKGFKLPDSWTEEEKENTSPEEEKDDAQERAMKAPADDKEDKKDAGSDEDKETSKDVEVDENGKHAPFKGTHSHKHPNFKDAKGAIHSREHSHDNDADHADKSADIERSVVTALTPESLAVYLPITRTDATSRTVTGQATVEKPDAYGTIFGYYPEAWLKWRGNMREQHDPKKAVGKAIEVIPDPEERAIYVTSKVSRGAQDTWLKIEDGVLSGYSASIIPDPEFGNDPRKWPKKEYEGKLYPYLPRYSVAETSYVDNPATPGCNISLVRADGFLTDVIDVEEVEEAPKEEQKPLERAGARISSTTRKTNHESIGHTLRAAASQMKNCDCPDCQAAMQLIDPDGDNDVDLGGYDDPDGDWQALYSTSKQSEADMERAVIGIIERSLSPTYTRLQAIAANLSKMQSANIEQVVTASIERVFGTILERLEELPTKANIDEVHAELSAVKDQVAIIADQPMPGGPVLNTNAIDKRLPTEPVYQEVPHTSYGAVYEAIQNLAKHGSLDTTEKQVAAMAAGLTAQRARR